MREVLEVIERGGDWQAALDRVYVGMEAALTAELGPPLLAGVVDSALITMARESLDLDTAALGRRAAEFAERYTYDLVSGITDTTRDRLSSAMRSFFDDEKIDRKTLGERVESIFGEGRGQTIATTEATRASAQGQRILVAELKVESPKARVQELWQTSEDEIVCEICGGLNGVVREEDGYHHPDGTVYDAPPAHPRCRCGARIVVLQIGGA
ncbi:MAG TPA: phage minor head protein [Anaerolineales bacterium]|nr:phage minor head protein [Anaerolineales bacterium]